MRVVGALRGALQRWMHQDETYEDLEKLHFASASRMHEIFGLTRRGGIQAGSSLIDAIQSTFASR